MSSNQGLLMDLVKRYLIALHKLNYNGCITAATAKYSYHKYCLDKTILFPALHRVVEAHSTLGIHLVDASTSTKYLAFQQLKLVDLMKVVH
jgi:hypothetical protein